MSLKDDLVAEEQRAMQYARAKFLASHVIHNIHMLSSLGSGLNDIISWFEGDKLCCERIIAGTKIGFETYDLTESGHYAQKPVATISLTEVLANQNECVKQNRIATRHLGSLRFMNMDEDFKGIVEYAFSEPPFLNIQDIPETEGMCYGFFDKDYIRDPKIKLTINDAVHILGDMGLDCFNPYGSRITTQDIKPATITGKILFQLTDRVPKNSYVTTASPVMEEQKL